MGWTVQSKMFSAIHVACLGWSTDQKQHSFWSVLWLGHAAWMAEGVFDWTVYLAELAYHLLLFNIYIYQYIWWLLKIYTLILRCQFEYVEFLLFHFVSDA